MIKNLNKIKKFFNVKIEKYSLKEKIPDIKFNICESTKNENNLIKLSNGLNVFYETPEIPTYITFGILINCGISHETKEFSGSLFWLKNSIENYLKNNYLKIYNNLIIDYCEDFFYINCNCMSYQLEEFMNVLSKCLKIDILSNNLLDNFNIDENKYKDEVKMVLHYEQNDQQLYDIFKKAAYGDNSYGLNKTDIKKNFENKKLFKEKSIKFLGDILNSKNIMIGSSGIINSFEYYNLAEKYFGDIKNIGTDLNNNIYNKELYKGGELYHNYKIENPFYKNMVKMGLGFETVNYKDPDLPIFRLINKIYGETSNFSTGGPGSGMYTRFFKNYHKMNYCNSLSNFNLNFLNSGLFGINVEIHNNYETYSLKSIINFLIELKSGVTDEELEISKKNFENNLYFKLQNQRYRLEEKMKEIKMFDEIYYEKLIQKVQNIESKDIERVMKKYLKNCTVTMIGENVNKYDLKKSIDLIFQKN